MTNDEKNVPGLTVEEVREACIEAFEGAVDCRSDYTATYYNELQEAINAKIARKV